MKSILKNGLWIGMAVAWVGAQAFAEESVYSKLSGLYAGGVLPVWDAYLGKVATGRCFLEFEPNRALPTFFTVEKHIEDVGPIAPPVTSYKGLVQFGPFEAPANYYDDKPLSGLDSTRVPLFESGGEYRMLYASGDEAGLRLSGQYLVVSLQDAKFKNLMCYYFALH